MCVQDLDVQCVLQFTLINAAGCALHRRTNRVIHRQECFSRSSSPWKTVDRHKVSQTGNVHHVRCLENKGLRKNDAGRPPLVGGRDERFARLFEPRRDDGVRRRRTSDVRRRSPTANALPVATERAANGTGTHCVETLVSARRSIPPRRRGRRGRQSVDRRPVLSGPDACRTAAVRFPTV